MHPEQNLWYPHYDTYPPESELPIFSSDFAILYGVLSYQKNKITTLKNFGQIGIKLDKISKIVSIWHFTKNGGHFMYISNKFSICKLNLKEIRNNKLHRNEDLLWLELALSKLQ